jgi:hypothetical protein
MSAVKVTPAMLVRYGMEVEQNPAPRPVDEVMADIERWAAGQAINNTAERAHSVLRELMDPDCFARVEQAVTDERGAWQADPWVGGVWAFVVAGEPVAIVHLGAGDYEADDDWFRA